MFDASAYELAEVESRHAGPAGAPTERHAVAEGDGMRPSTLTDPAALTLPACATCQSALGDCAVEAARAGALSPAIALAVCTAMHRLVGRAMRAPMASLPAYVAVVVLGAARSEADRRSDLEAIAETMR